MLSLEEIPSSWYALEVSENVPQGEMVSVSFLNRDYVIYRDQQNQVHAIGAYCPHRGSHLGADGVILSEGIACRAHQKRFDQDGNCTNDNLCPPVRKLETCEANGLIMVWYDRNHSPSRWKVTPFAPLSSGRYSKIFWTRLPEFKTHPSILLQDVFDNGHFESLHGLIQPETQVSGTANLLRTHTRAKVRLSRVFDVFKRQGRNALSGFATRMVNSAISGAAGFLERYFSLEINLSSEVHGLGLVAYQVRISGVRAFGLGPGELNYLIFSAGTPKDPNRLSVSLGICTEKMPFRFVEKFIAHCLIRETALGYEADRPRWEGQLVSRHQHTCEGDEGVAFFENAVLAAQR